MSGLARALGQKIIYVTDLQVNFHVPQSAAQMHAAFGTSGY